MAAGIVALPKKPRILRFKNESIMLSQRGELWMSSEEKHATMAA